MSPRPVLVCDTGPLIALEILGLEDVLPQIFHPVVPKQVLDELCEDDEPSGLPESYEIAGDTFIDPLLSSLLDPGEAAVIQLALDRQIPTVLMDERRGRKVARKIYGLQTIGTARFLVEARKSHLVPALPELFAKLKSNSYWIADDIVRWATDSTE